MRNGAFEQVASADRALQMIQHSWYSPLGYRFQRFLTRQIARIRVSHVSTATFATPLLRHSLTVDVKYYWIAAFAKDCSKVDWNAKSILFVPWHGYGIDHRANGRIDRGISYRHICIWEYLEKRSHQSVRVGPLQNRLNSQGRMPTIMRI